MSTVRTITARNGRAWAGLESEPVAEGRHARAAAWALAERLYGAGKFTLRELNPWNYEVTIPEPSAPACTSPSASPVQKPQELHP